ncbi:MAG: hypothetical protein GX160_05600 [Clostridiales bacterium]|nr:hypothetical protein [Clostridiales bacterium]
MTTLNCCNIISLIISRSINNFTVRVVGSEEISESRWVVRIDISKCRTRLFRTVKVHLFIDERVDL